MKRNRLPWIIGAAALVVAASLIAVARGVPANVVVGTAMFLVALGALLGVAIATAIEDRRRSHHH